MSLFRRLFTRRANPLLGAWQGIDDPTIEMVFYADGRLEYRAREGDTVQIMKLTYRVEGTQIISDQPSSPREERTEFRFDGSHLVLTHNGETTRYARVCS